MWEVAKLQIPGKKISCFQLSIFILFILIVPSFYYVLFIKRSLTLGKISWVVRGQY